MLTFIELDEAISSRLAHPTPDQLQQIAGLLAIAAKQYPTDWQALLNQHQVPQRLQQLQELVLQALQTQQYQFTVVPELNKIYLKHQAQIVADILCQDFNQPLQTYFNLSMSEPGAQLLRAYLSSGSRWQLLWLGLLLGITADKFA